MSSLREKTFSALSWVSISVAVSTALRSLSKLVLANILAPSAFGLMSLALLATETGNLFRRLGLGDALIVRQDDIEMAADTAFVMLVAAAAVIYTILYLLAPLVSSFFGEQPLVDIVRALSLVLILYSVGQVPSALMEKELEFRALLVPDVSSSVSRIVVAVALGIQGFGVWSLVGGELAAVGVSTVLILYISPYRPSLSFDRDVATELLQFGSEITLSGVASFVYKKVDDLAIGWLLGSTALGYYGIALALANLPESLFNQIPTKALFPTFAELDVSAKRKLWYLSARAVAMLSIPAGIGILVIAPNLVQIALGARWLPAVPVLRLLVVYGTLRSLASGAGNVLKTTGNVSIHSRLMSSQAFFLAALVFPLTEFAGLEGAGVALTVSAAVNYLGHLYFANQSVGLPQGNLFVPFLKYTVIGGTMGCVVWIFQHRIAANDIFDLSLLVITGVVTYGIALLVFDREFIGTLYEEFDFDAFLPLGHFRGD